MEEQNIYVIDPLGGTGKECACGADAMFLVGINGHELHVCCQCIAELGKRIIDGLT